MKIEFYYYKFDRESGCEVGECDNTMIGYLEFIGFNQCICVCENHKNSITEDNPLLIPYLKLLDVCY